MKKHIHYPSGNAPAFPTQLSNPECNTESIEGHAGEEILPGHFSSYSGVSERVYVATRALAALIPIYDGIHSVEQVASTALSYADALLAARTPAPKDPAEKMPV